MKYLASKKLALILLIAIAVLAVVGMIIPQVQPGKTGYILWKTNHQGIAPFIETLQLNQMFNSWWIKIVSVLFLINLSACTYRQTMLIIKERKNEQKGIKFKDIKVPIGINIGEQVCSYLTSKRFKYSKATNNDGVLVIKGKKYSFSRWSIVVFHIGLIVVLIGILLSILGKSDGLIPIMEGQQVNENKDSYVLINRGILAGSYTELPITVKKINVYMDKSDKSIKNEQEEIQLGNEEFVIDSKNPVTTHGFTVYREKMGYTVTLKYTSKDGSSSDFTAPLLINQEKNNLYSNDFNIPDSPYTISATLYPNAVKNTNRTEGFYSDGTALLNPLVQVAIEGPQTAINNTFIKKGETFSFDGVKLQVKDIGYWCSIRLVRDPGVNLIYAGFLISILALIAMYLLVPKKIYIEINHDEIVIYGFASHFRNLYNEELEELVEFIKMG